MESLPLQAFIIGLVSACSLPLGTLTSAVWQPKDRTIAILMAFGGGALLAALSIDLVSPALEAGHFRPLAVGCILGGLAFRGLNHLVNSQGGFLRKASTTIYYLRRQQQQHFSRALSQIGRLDIFRDLPQEEIQQLAEAVTGQDYPEGMIVYRQNDPSSYLFIVEKGEVELRDPNKNMRVFQRLQPYEIFPAVQVLLWL